MNVELCLVLDSCDLKMEEEGVAAEAEPGGCRR